MDYGNTITVRTYQDGTDVVLAIEDQGTGIAEHVIDKLGTPFFTTKENGTGLGLAVCYSIAARHQAHITIETSPSGSIFFVRFKACGMS
jgi:signal transduction histidine kinase